MSESKLILVSNLNAFLDTISFSEGTQIAGSDDGYDVIVGGGLFKGYARPQQFKVWIERIKNYSSAIGRYQILYKYAVHYMAQLNLPDFSPRSQDKIALQLIRECKATQLILDGAISQAIMACNSRWASFPGNAYGQRQEKMDNLLQFFVAAGGTIK
jgi:muramidase (phage lysozyme)